MHEFLKSNITPKFDGFWTINGDDITMLLMSRHEDFIDNVVLGIQNKHV